MADKSSNKLARKRLAWLLVIFIGFAGLIAGATYTKAPGATLVPQLALDLQGGTQVILKPNVSGEQSVSKEQLAQAVDIIRQRIDSTGVSEAQITTQGEGTESAIVVSIPGTPSDNTLELIKASAKLEFRAVLVTGVGSSALITPPATKDNPKPTPTLPQSSPIATSGAAPTDNSDLNWVTAELQAEYEALDCSKEFRTPGQIDDPTKPLVTCDRDRTAKFILGPVELDGTEISKAVSSAVTTSQGSATGQYAVDLTFNAAGKKKFGDVTTRVFPLTAPRNQFAVTIDGYIITAPTIQAVITGGTAQITGNFTNESATALANQLKYGSLPIGFQVQSQENISATLGTQQLQSGLLAGAIGMLLVFIYSLFQYRALASITIGSLAVAAGLTYLTITLLSWRMDYRLSLAGVAGLIVAIGITADSFIVYFERVRDELREGRPLSVAVTSGWKRAWRTILVSDVVSLLAAGTLYFLTVGNVKGFAFTLGITTIIDLAVVTLFTVPMLMLFANLRFFTSGNVWSGFEVKGLTGERYTGRFSFRDANTSIAKNKKSAGEAAKRQTIAERKAAGSNKEAGDN
jgi:preprotein translocase subunit SecD